jgi:hypothetical protein
MSIQTRWPNQPEQVRYRARLPPISKESRPIPSMIPMIRSTAPDIPLVYIRNARHCHGWDSARKLLSSRPSSDLPDALKTDAGACYVLHPAGWWKGR